jgi:hypothetical protein
MQSRSIRTKNISLLSDVRAQTYTFRVLSLPINGLVYRPNFRQKSDSDILRDAKLEAMGFSPQEREDRGSKESRQTATDEAVMERFKKRLRK